MPWGRSRWALVAAVASLALFAACGGSAPEDRGPAARTPAAEETAFSSALCLTCHSRPGISVRSFWGVERELAAVTPYGFYTSVHGEMECVDCHKDRSSLPHAKFTESGEPVARATDASDICRSCHSGAAERFLDSIHGTGVMLGDKRAPGCTDCHSAHYVQAAETWSATAKAAACSKCHQGADTAFAGALTHREPSPARLALDYYATRFFGALVVAVIGVGIIHVELDLLRWLKDKLAGGKRKDNPP